MKMLTLLLSSLDIASENVGGGECLILTGGCSEKIRKACYIYVERTEICLAISFDKLLVK